MLFLHQHQMSEPCQLPHGHCCRITECRCIQSVSLWSSTSMPGNPRVSCSLPDPLRTNSLQSCWGRSRSQLPLLHLASGPRRWLLQPMCSCSRTASRRRTAHQARLLLRSANIHQPCCLLLLQQCHTSRADANSIAEHLLMMLRGEKAHKLIVFARYCGFGAAVWAPLRPTTSASKAGHPSATSYHTIFCLMRMQSPSDLCNLSWQQMSKLAGLNAVSGHAGYD